MDRRDGPADGPAREGDEPPGTIDAVHELLSSRRRRYALYHLLEAGGELGLSELATRVVASEFDRDPADLPVDVRQRTYLDLYHTHLPKLDRHDVVAYDEDDGTVSLADSDTVLVDQLTDSIANESGVPDPQY